MDTLRNASQDSLSLANHRESEIHALQQKLQAAAVAQSLMEVCVNQNIAIAARAQQRLSASQGEAATAQAQAIMLGARILALEGAPSPPNPAVTEPQHTSSRAPPPRDGNDEDNE